MVNHYVKNEEGLFICPHKGCTYKPQRLMQTMFYHLMSKHSEEDELPYKCEHCRKGFLHKKTLENHVLSQHPEETLEEVHLFNCPIPGCEFSSLTKGNCRIHLMRKHMKDATGKLLEKKEGNVWHCRACGVDFKNSTGFYYHVTECLPQRMISAPAIRKILF